ncbi:uncharacterized protein FOMMEDRAFT_84803, partial [Fomitiporia mediterranea MF3/22]|uniref:uncharacterized protein n=1 Tax=Fomitiporia mediterranea (strain MF3/22) TaxID=694068 RepID=UPI00044088B1
LTLFFRPVKRRKAIKIGSGTQRRAGQAHSEVVVNTGNELSPEDAELFETLCEENEQGLDEGQQIHDMHIAVTVRNQAIEEMRSKGVILQDGELQEAEMVLYKVAGLAKRVNDNAFLKARFESLVEAAVKDQDSPITGDKRVLARRVATRWNSDLACLDSYFLLYPIVQQLTGIREYKLQSFILSDTQLALARELREVLSIIEEPTCLFSQAKVPLVAEVLPMLLVVQRALRQASEDQSQPHVFWIAAHAGSIVCQKYYALSDESEVYYMAIVMSPDKKMSWFLKENFTLQEVTEIQKLVVSHWEESYKKYQRSLAQSVALQNAHSKVFFQTFSNTYSNVFFLESISLYCSGRGVFI